jgi:hypothetical protein
MRYTVAFWGAFWRRRRCLTYQWPVLHTQDIGRSHSVAVLWESFPLPGLVFASSFAHCLSRGFVWTLHSKSVKRRRGLCQRLRR